MNRNKLKLSHSNLILSDDEIINIGAEVIRIEAHGLESLARRLNDSFVRAVKMLNECHGRVFFTGIGKSGIIGKKIAGSLSSVGIPSFFIHPVEALHGDLGMVNPEADIAFILSYSGETAEILRLVEWMHRLSIPILVMTGNTESSLARYSDIALDIGVMREATPGGAMPTTSTTVALALGDALVVALMKLRGITDESFAMYHPSGSLGRKFLTVGQFMHTGERIPIVSPTTPVGVLVETISRKGFGCALVVDSQGILCGIVTDGDVRRGVGRFSSFDGVTTSEIMTREPKTISMNALAADALKLLESFRITMLPVVDDNNHPIGLVHLHDLWRTRLF